jgi:hypothetical protein
MLKKMRFLGLLLALTLASSALAAALPPPAGCAGSEICKICGCPRCPICPICCAED